MISVHIATDCQQPGCTVSTVNTCEQYLKSVINVFKYSDRVSKYKRYAVVERCAKYNTCLEEEILTVLFQDKTAEQGWRNQTNLDYQIITYRTEISPHHAKNQCINAVLMLGQRRRRWPNNKTALITVK